MLNYAPRPGSVAEQAIAYLQQHGPTRSTEVAIALDKRGADMYAFLKAAFRHRAILATGAGGRVRVIYLPGQDPGPALQKQLDWPIGSATAAAQASLTTPTETAPAMSTQTRTRKNDRNTPGTAQPAEPLQMATWNDGDTVVQGDALQFVTSADGDVNGVMFTREQLRQLVDFVARPVVALS